MAKLHLAQEILNIIYPVGSIYLSTSTTNPSTYFGGTWEQVARGHYLLGYDANNPWFNRPGQNKGSANGPGSWDTNYHTLTINEMPNHYHQLTGNGEGPGLYPNWGTNSGWGVPAQHLNGNGGIVYSGSTGGGGGHNHFHVSPYYIIVVWKRTA